MKKSKRASKSSFPSTNDSLSTPRLSVSDLVSINSTLQTMEKQNLPHQIRSQSPELMPMTGWASPRTPYKSSLLTPGILFPSSRVSFDTLQTPQQQAMSPQRRGIAKFIPTSTISNVTQPSNENYLRTVTNHVELNDRFAKKLEEIRLQFETTMEEKRKCELAQLRKALQIGAEAHLEDVRNSLKFSGGYKIHSKKNDRKERSIVLAMVANVLMEAEEMFHANESDGLMMNMDDGDDGNEISMYALRQQQPLQPQQQPTGSFASSIPLSLSKGTANYVLSDDMRLELLQLVENYKLAKLTELEELINSKTTRKLTQVQGYINKRNIYWEEQIKKDVLQIESLQKMEQEAKARQEEEARVRALRQQLHSNNILEDTRKQAEKQLISCKNSISQLNHGVLDVLTMAIAECNNKIDTPTSNSTSSSSRFNGSKQQLQLSQNRGRDHSSEDNGTNRIFGLLSKMRNLQLALELAQSNLS